MSAPAAPEGSMRVWRNSLTLVGGVITLVAVLFTLSFLFFDLVSPTPSPYVGLFTYLLFPAFIVLGVVLIVAGLVRTRRRLRRLYGSISKLHYYPRIDFNLPSHRRVLAGVGAGMAVALPFVGILSYEGYNYTDSTEFCGQVCHTVMQPQDAAHRASPHARVDCAECHIGRGATSYVEAKLSGVRQLVATTLGTYPRPIPAGILQLRPARETCENCHWPEKYFGDQLVTIRSFASDERSTPRVIEMLVKTGGGDPAAGPLGGIHWHMAASHTTEFVALDRDLQEIPWVRSVDRKTGRVRVYRSDGKPADAPPPAGIARTMDCLDCHNRAAHEFPSAARSADAMLVAKPALRELPFAKRELAAALAANYASHAEGVRGVARTLHQYYETQHGELVAAHGETLERLVTRAQRTYARSVFPEMRVDSRTYPDNIGHKTFPGCFRCHAGNHVDAEGNAISATCDTCHEFLREADDGEGRSLVVNGDFTHPVELVGVHAALPCHRCHAGPAEPAPTCEGCHVEVTAFRDGSAAAFAAFGIEADVMDGIADCTSCHDLEQPLAAVQGACLDCHEAAGYGDMVAAWKREYSALRAVVAPARRDPAVLDALRRAGPWHNMEATRRILKSLAEEGAGSGSAGVSISRPELAMSMRAMGDARRPAGETGLR